MDHISEIYKLGICFDMRFSFDIHVDNSTGKCTAVINSLAKSSKLKWVLGHPVLNAL